MLKEELKNFHYSNIIRVIKSGLRRAGHVQHSNNNEKLMWTFGRISIGEVATDKT